MRAPTLVLASVLVAACSGSPGNIVEGGQGGAGGGNGGSNGANGGSLGGDTKPGTSSSSPQDCSEAAKLVYVVTAENDLYSFSPATLKFAPVGPLNCPASDGATPFSMAVDRSGTAYVNYTDGAVFRVSTTDASCKATAFSPQSGFTTFGMGFVSDAPGSSAETLYVCGFDFQSNGADHGLGLAKIDVASMSLTPISDFSGALRGVGAELTGTGDARLFGFFEGSPSKLAAIDKSAASTPNVQSLPGVETSSNSAFAFSFWGGDFWFYTAQGGSRSKVTRLKAATDGSSSVVVQDTGMTIVGAGVSTCAPTKPVK